MKILLTGHKGYIGKVLKFRLESIGHEVEGFEWSDGSFPDVMGYNHVIHLGAISSTTETDLDKIMVQNHDFSCRLLIACNQAGVDLMYASSASVYGLTEDNTPNPLNNYAWTKYLFDRLVEQNLNQKGSKINIEVKGLRLFNVWGIPEAEMHKGSQASLMTQFHNKETVKLFKGSEGIYRDFIHVSDVCSIIISLLNVPKSGFYDVGTGTQRSFLDVANVLVNSDQYMPTKIEWIEFPLTLIGKYQDNTKAYNAKLIKEIGLSLIHI